MRAGALRPLLGVLQAAQWRSGGAAAAAAVGSSGALGGAAAGFGDADSSGCGGSGSTAWAAWAQQQQRRHKHSVRMVLLQDHPKLGSTGEVVAVKAGYARHVLFPSGAADYAVPGVLRAMRERGLLRGAAAEAQPGRRRGRLQPQQRQGAGGAAGQLEAGQPGAGDLAECLRILSNRSVTAKRRYRWRSEDQGMVGSVRAADVSGLVARQLSVQLPPELVMLDRPITEFGEFKVPLNLATPDGRQVELKVEVVKNKFMR